MATTVPYTTSTNSLERFLQLIPRTGTPQKVNGPYLKGVGFKSGNDSYLVPILKQLGLLDPTGAPTDAWRKYRNDDEAKSVLAKGVQIAYAGLFETYEDAHRKDDEALRNWFRAQTDFNDTKVKQAVATFRTLCKFSDFDAQVAPGGTSAAPVPHRAAAPRDEGSAVPVTPPAAVQVPAGPNVTINIQVQLPASADGEAYDKFFEAMKRHLYPDGSSV